MRDDNDAAASAIFDGVTGTLLHVDFPAVPLKKDFTTDLGTKRLYFFFFPPRTLRATIRPPRRAKAARAWLAIVESDKADRARRSLPCRRWLASDNPEGIGGSMSRPGKELVDDFEVVARVDLVGRQDAIFTIDLEDGDGDHQVLGKLEGVGLCEGKIVRHARGSIGERADSRSMAPQKEQGRARSPRWQSLSGRSLLADPSRVDRGRCGTGSGRHQRERDWFASMSVAGQKQAFLASTALTDGSPM
jgi:hypothetical protein